MKSKSIEKIIVLLIFLSIICFLGGWQCPLYIGIIIFCIVIIPIFIISFKSKKQIIVDVDAYKEKERKKLIEKIRIISCVLNYGIQKVNSETDDGKEFLKSLINKNNSELIAIKKDLEFSLNTLVNYFP